MKTPAKFITLLSLMALSHLALSQTVLGKWKTIDDETGEQKSIVEIFERGGNVNGRIVKLFRKPNEVHVLYILFDKF